MKACTSVVTEISYHPKKIIAAEVAFLSLDEWMAELAILQKDLTEEDGSAKRIGEISMKSEAGIAWQKVRVISDVRWFVIDQAAFDAAQCRAVYPNLTPDDIVSRSLDEILGSNPGMTFTSQLS